MAEFSLGDAELGTSVDTSGLAKGLNDAEGKAKGGVSRLGGFLENALSFATGGLIQKGIENLFGTIVSGVGDAQNSVRLMAATEQTITTMGNAAGVTAQHVADMAASLSDANGQSLFGDDQIQESTNLLLTFGEIKGATLDAATALTVDLAQALGGAPQDQAMMLGKALNDPIHGMSALGKAGLTFSEEQKAAITAMQESGDMAGAQAIIIAELNKQVGGQAAAAAGAAGGWVQFKANLGETFETIGASLLPALNALGAWLNSPEVTSAIQAIAAAMVTAFTWMVDNIPPIIATVTAAVNDGIAIITGLFDGPMADSLDSNQQFFTDTFATVSSIVTDTAALVTAILGALAGFIVAHGTEIKLVLSGAWQLIQGVITAALALISGVIKTALALIRGDWSGAWDAIVTMSRGFVTGLGTAILGGLNIIAGYFGTSMSGILDTWRGNWDMLVSIVQKLPGALAGAGAAIVQAIWDGIAARWQALVDWFSNKLQELKDQLPFSEPKDRTSPLYGLGKSGKSIVGMLQSGIADAPPLQIAPLDMPAMGQLSAAGANMAGVNVTITIADRGVRWLENLIDTRIDQVVTTAGTRALSRGRTGN